MSHAPLVVTWRLRRTYLPRILHRCAGCAAMSTFEPTGRFRVNANRKRLDVWLLLRCAACSRVLKATIVERASVRSIAPALLKGYQCNDPGLVARIFTDPSFRRRNRLTLDFEGIWELAAEPIPSCRGRPVTVRVEFVDPLPVRPVQLIAAGLGISRNQVERLLAAGTIRSPTRLDGQTSAGFRFTIDPSRQRLGVVDASEEANEGGTPAQHDPAISQPYPDVGGEALAEHPLPRLGGAGGRGDAELAEQPHPPAW